MLASFLSQIKKNYCAFLPEIFLERVLTATLFILCLNKQFLSCEDFKKQTIIKKYFFYNSFIKSALKSKKKLFGWYDKSKT
jgi:hypothetical protein